MFRNLTLKNFKRHEHLVVDFTAGLNGIFGPNYKGKSTLLYALLYALGGASHVPGTRLARRGSDGRFSVELVFDIAGASYSVSRTKSTANLYQVGTEEPLATGTTGVNEKIEELIGMSVKQWKELHYAKQKNAHSLLRYSANNLHSLMRRLVGAEELDAVQQRLKRMFDKEDGLINALEPSAFSAEECQDELTKATELITALETHLILGEEKVKDLESNEQQGLESIQKATDRLQAAQKLKGMVETYSARLHAAQRGVDAARETLAEATAEAEKAIVAYAKAQHEHDPEAGKKIAQSESLKLKLAAAERGVEDAKTRLEGAEAKLKKALAAATESTKALQKAVEREGDVGLKLVQANEALEAAKTERTLRRQRVSDLQAAADGAECPTCNRPFEGHDPAKLAAELESAIHDEEVANNAMFVANSEVEQLQSVQKVMAAAERLAVSDTDAASRAEHAVADCKGDLADAEDALLAVQGDINDLALTEEDITRLRGQSQALAFAQTAKDKAEDAQAKADRAVDLANDALKKVEESKPEGTLADLEAEIAKLSARLTKDRATLVELRAALTEARQTLSGVTNERAAALGQERTWKERLERLQKDGERRDTAMKRAARIKLLQKHLKDNAEGYMGKVWATFMAQASRFASQCTGGDIQGLERSDDGAFTFLEEGEVMQLEEASGAQEAIIGLAVQMALSAAAPCHLNVLLLDEPTADMDPNCSMATMAAMKALGQQVVFVSHQPDDNALCDNAITL